VNQTPWMTIGTRGSPLALTQARAVRTALALAHGRAPEDIAIRAIRTTGDAIQDRALSEAGGKGLFTRELDIALAAGEIDIAVHSSKDLPTQLPPELCIAGYLPREDVRDALICPVAGSIEALPPGVRVGTASLRRGALIARLRPDARIVLLRGNVETRLARIAAGAVDATLLALAGLKRLGLQDRASAVLDPETFPPAAGQGAIGVTARRDDPASLARVEAIDHRPTHLALLAERAFMDVVDGSCRTPIAAHARLDGAALSFYGIVLRPDGQEFFEAREDGDVAMAAEIGRRAGQRLRLAAPADMFG